MVHDMGEILSGDLRIAYRRKGSGSPVVFLHGALSDHRTWNDQLDEFSGAFDVIAWDAPGCGSSSDPPVNSSLADYATSLASLIDQLGLDRPHLVGISFGGGLALEFYRNYPNVPRSLALVSAYAGWAGSLSKDEVEKRLQQAWQKSYQTPAEIVNTWLPTLFSDSTSESVMKETAEMMSDFHPAGLRAMLNAFARADLREVLPTIKIPTLLVYGDADQRSPLHIARELHAEISKSRLSIIEGVGHVVHKEAPAEFNTVVRNFIKSV